jgi:hypothetical protein
MAFMSWNSFKATGDVVSSILNWVCPECGGRMGGRGQEFKCQGACLTDWRPVWDRTLVFGNSPSQTSALELALNYRPAKRRA